MFVYPSNLVELWLGVLPDFVVLFTIFFLFSNLVNQLTVGVTPAIQAVGKIKKFQMVIGTTALVVLPISYVLLEFNFPITYVLSLLVLIEVVTGIMKIWFFSEILSIKKTWYFKNIVAKMVFPFVITNALLYLNVRYFMIQGEVILVSALSFLIYIPISYLLSLNKNEKEEVKSMFMIIIKKIIKRK